MKWQRDPGVLELVKYFDQPDIAPSWDGSTGGWARLMGKPNELKAIEDMIRKCRGDFSFFSRNFLWIVDKQRRELPFSLFESQELLLEKIMALKASGKAQKLMILKARQLGALDPDTLVLTAALGWKRIGDVSVGDTIIGVEEYPSGGRGAARKFTNTTVLNKWHVTKPAYRIIFEGGKSITATADHPFLCKKRGAVHTEWRKVNELNPRAGSRAGGSIRPGDEVRFICDPWSPKSGFEDGWFAGLVDGEGSLRAKSGAGIELSVSQVSGPVWDRAIQYLRDNNYDYRIEIDSRVAGASSKLGNQPVNKAVLGQLPQVLRALGELNPSRFAGRKVWDGKELPNNGAACWARVIAVEPLLAREMVDIETTSGTFIAEGLVTHNCSTLIEGLITWRAVLFGSVSALIVSNTPSHASYLFGILQFAYDRLPWWMKPMTLSRKIEEGLIFDNADHKTRHIRPGLNSKIAVQAANQTSGVGQGRTITAAHISELSDWTDEEGRSVIEGDLGHALAESPETFAIIESTARGTGNYFHRLWRKSVELGELAEWQPVFLPWFFERNRKISIPHDKWKPDYPEQEMRDRVSKDWVRCDNKFCSQYRESIQSGVRVEGTRCPVCEIGILQAYNLSDEQLHWMQLKRLNAQKDADSLKELRAEQTSTPEESFQLSGMQVFPQEALDFINYNIEEPLAKGFFDKVGNFHGVDSKTGRCPLESCDVDHSYDECPVQIWRYPEKGATYVAGVDVAEGLGEDYDYSIIFVNKVGGLQSPDEQVALFRSNTIDPVSFAYPVNHLGRWYNEAMLAIEINKYDTTFSYVRNQCGYPHLYRWKHVDSTNMLSQKWGWESNIRSKPRLYQTGIHWLRHRMWIIHSRNFHEEAGTYQKENADDRGAKAEKGFYDDEVMAGFIALYCAHDADWDENLGSIRVRRMSSGDPDTYMWRVICNKCNYERGVQSPEGRMYCLECGSPYVRAEKNASVDMGLTNLWEELEDGQPAGPNEEPIYDLI